MSELATGRRRPWIIVGDRGKLETEGPTLAPNFAARKALDRATHLAVVGYSFGDSHVNSLIRDWLAFDDTRTISILDRSWHLGQRNNERDFRTALVEHYSREKDYDGNPVSPRLVGVKGTAASHLADVLAARPAMPKAPSLELHEKVASGGRAIVATWHGAHLYNAYISADSISETESSPNFAVQLLLKSEEGMPTTNLSDLSRRANDYVAPINLEELADGESLELLLPGDAPDRLSIQVNGLTLTGSRKHASCRTR